MLTAEHITCGYGGEPVVRNVSFRVKEGERLAILGPNGCGKTTLMRALAGLLPFEGEVTAAGLSIKTAPRKQAAKALALMTQMGGADFSYTVYEAVMMGRYAHQKGGLFGGASREDREIAEACLRDTGLSDLRERPVTQLSGGQLQRVFLARVFCQQPSVILLDEPTNHLDLKVQVDLIDLLKRWTAQPGRCCVGVLHDINLALAFADRILLLDEGRTVYEGPAGAFDLALLEQVYGMDVRGFMQKSLGRWGTAPTTAGKIDRAGEAKIPS